MRPAKLRLVVLAAFAVGCTGEAPAPEEYSDSVTADPTHYSVEFENDAVRLIRVSYGPGEESVMHTHPAYCAVALTDGSWEMTDPEGAVTELPLAAGETVCVDAEVHSPRNGGTEVASGILVEFKEGAMAGSATSEHPGAVTADPDHYAVEFENDVARLLRIRYGPGETSVMHSHPANCAIFLQDAVGTFELPDGEVVDIPAVEPGQVVCVDAEAHLPTNTGEGGIEVVVVELKGREALQN